VPTGNNPFAVCVDPVSNLVFVTNKGDSTVAVVDGKTNTKTGSVTVSSNFIDVNPITKLLYTSDDSGATSFTSSPNRKVGLRLGQQAAPIWM